MTAAAAFPTTIRFLRHRPRGAAAWPFLPRAPFGVSLLQGDSLEVLSDMIAERSDGVFDLIVADPPYRLSNGGITCRSGRMASVDKASWDRSHGFRKDHEWNLAWLRRCRQLMKADATIWATGTHHNVFSLGVAMRQLGMKILNVITWEKPDPPPNLSHRYFQHSHELVIWAAKTEDSRHRFNYDEMCRMAGGRQMQTVWRGIAPPGADEKRFGRHPTQKPVALIRRMILASTVEGDVILDPFIGSGTTAVAAVETGRQCVGLDENEGYLEIAARRIESTLRIRRSLAIAG